MEMKIYGHGGKPALAFPTEGGSHSEFEDYAMIDACEPFIAAGRLRLATVGSVDLQSWANYSVSPPVRAQRHEEYERYILEEVVPKLSNMEPKATSGILTMGCSTGGYHAANFFFRHPGVFDAVIALSGMLQLRLYIGDYMDQTVYFHSPLDYLRNLHDVRIIDQLRQNTIIVCAGRGDWDWPMVADAETLRLILDAKGIRAWIDIWGSDVTHDWHWWRKQLPYFLPHVPGV